jgi:hypothetical protein
MFKVIGGGYLTWDELSEVMLDIEIQINRLPLTYVEDDIELLTLTPASFLHQGTCESFQKKNRAAIIQNLCASWARVKYTPPLWFFFS